MTKREAIEWVRSHDDSDSLDDAELSAAFAAIYGREPDRDDQAEGLWSHCCAAAE